jgi:hypothetical protein
MRTVKIHSDNIDTLHIMGADYDNILAELFGISAHYYTIRITASGRDRLREALSIRFPHKQLERAEELFKLIRWLILISSSVEAFRNFLEKRNIFYEFISYKNQMAEVA